MPYSRGQSWAVRDNGTIKAALSWRRRLESTRTVLPSRNLRSDPVTFQFRSDFKLYQCLLDRYHCQAATNPVPSATIARPMLRSFMRDPSTNAALDLRRCQGSGNLGSDQIRRLVHWVRVQMRIP